jgi:hypothetical protein
MKPYFLGIFAGTVVLVLALAGRAGAQADADNPPPPPTPPGVEVQARGPVHEAYAEPAQARPEPTPLVNRQPPEPIDEVPPDQKPEGDNVVWIPGYWSYDIDASDFLWVSGIWRVPPPGRVWVPGSWQQVQGGWHWVAGLWAEAGQDQLQYLPAPPPSVDEGPSMSAPEGGGTYAPGCWVFRASRYFWRPGFWVSYHPGWLWVNAHYVWTPAGYLFVEGYWDRPLETRGVLFAPVRIDRAVVAGTRWSYTPAYAIQPDFLLTALFVRPANCHYYFGDYFEARYQKAGFFPWVDYRVAKGCYDAAFAYYRQSFARHDGWEKNLRELYAARLRGDVPRPPHTLVQQTEEARKITLNRTANVAVHKSVNITHAQNVSVLAPLPQLHNTRVTALAGLGTAPKVEGRVTVSPPVVKLQPVPRPQVLQEQKAAVQFRAVEKQRREGEARILSAGAGAIRPAETPRQVKIEVPRPPAAKVDVRAHVEVQAHPVPHAPPPHPPLPAHVERPIPHHEPPKPPAPPRR